MSHRSSRLASLVSLALAVLASAAIPDAATAQEGYAVSPFAEFGIVRSFNTLGKNASAVQDIPILQAVAELSTNIQYGGGVAVTLPGGGIRVRGRFLTTNGRQIEGRLLICKAGGDFGDQPVCQPRSADAKVQTLAAEVQFLRGHETSMVRPVLSLGAGLRNYSLGSVECNESDSFVQDACLLIRNIWADDGGWTPTLVFGVGVEARLGRLTGFVQAQEHFGSYPGGAGGADGNTQNDLVATMGLAMRVR